MASISFVDEQIDYNIDQVEKCDKPLGYGFLFPILGQIAAVFYMAYLAWNQRSAISTLKQVRNLGLDHFSPQQLERIQTCLTQHGIAPIVSVSTQGIVLEGLKEIFGQELFTQDDPSFRKDMVPFYLSLVDFKDAELEILRNEDRLNFAVSIFPDTPDIIQFKKAYKKYPVVLQKVIQLRKKREEWKRFFNIDSFSVKTAITEALPGYKYSNEHIAQSLFGQLSRINKFWETNYGQVDKEELFEIVLNVSPIDDTEKNLELFSEFLKNSHEKTIQIFKDWTSVRKKHQKNPTGRKPLSPEKFVKVFKSTKEFKENGAKTTYSQILNTTYFWYSGQFKNS